MRPLLAVVCLGMAVRALAIEPIDEFPGAVVRPAKRNLPRPAKPPPPPAPKAPSLPPSAPRTPTCVLGLEVVQRQTADGARLEGFVRNRSPKPVVALLVNACPSPPMRFDGLPPGVSAFHTCAMGPCIERAPIELRLAPGERRRLSEGFVPWAGSDCSAPVRPQRFAAQGAVSFIGAGVSTCVEASSTSQVAPRPPTLPAPAPPPPPTPRATCPPPEPCGVYCEFGQAKDANGCTTCGCNPNPLRPLWPGNLESP